MVVKIQINALFCPHVYWNSVYVTSSPPLPLPGPLSLRFKKQFNDQSNIRPLSAKIYMERLTQLLTYGSPQVLFVGGFETKLEVSLPLMLLADEQPQRCCAQTVRH